MKTVKLKPKSASILLSSPSAVVPVNGRYFALSNDGSRLFSVETEFGSWTTHKAEGVNAPLKANTFECVEDELNLGKQTARPIFVGADSFVALASNNDTLMLLNWNDAASACVKKANVTFFKMGSSIQRISALSSEDFSVTLRSGDVSIFTKKENVWTEKHAIKSVCSGADETFEMNDGKIGVLCWKPANSDTSSNGNADISVVDLGSGKVFRTIRLQLEGLASFIIDAKFKQAWMFYDSGFGKLQNVSLETGETKEMRLFTKNLFGD